MQGKVFKINIRNQFLKKLYKRYFDLNLKKNNFQTVKFFILKTLYIYFSDILLFVKAPEYQRKLIFKKLI